MDIEKLATEGQKLWHEAKSIMEQYEGKEMPADKTAEVDRLLDAVQANSKQIERIKSVQSAGEFYTKADESKRLGSGELVETKDGKSVIETKQGDQAELERKAFDALLRGGRSSLTPEMKAALNEGTNSQGGYLTPVQYSNEVVKALTAESIIRAAGAQVQAISAKELRQPSLTNTTRAVLTAEAAAFDEVEPTFGEIVFTPYKYTRLVKASDEVLEDAEVNLFSDIIMPDIVQAFAAGENADFTTGTGSGQPQGVVSGASIGVTLSAGQTVTISSADSLIDLYHSVPYLYRQNGKFMMNDDTIKLVRKLKDSTNQYIWQPGLNAGQPDRLLGKELVTNNSMAVPAANALTVLFGDFRYFKIVDRKGLEIKALNELYAANGQVGWRAYKRYDSDILLAAAFRTLKQSAT